MARRSQCSSAGDNPLDPNYLPPHYREEYRLAIDALVEGDLEGYYEFLQKADVVDFLSTPEIQHIMGSVQGPQLIGHSEQLFLESGGDGSSDTYWPIHSDQDVPDLDLGWPHLQLFSVPTEVTTLVNPPEPDMPSIKEQARRLIKNAQQVIAIAMDMFTDVDIFADVLNAATRNVAVYILLDELNAHHFVSMVSNCRVNLQSIQFLRVRTVSGSSYKCRSGKSFKGQMMDRFLLTDCRAVLSGNYSFMWSFEKLHRCMAHLFFGQLVTTFDEEFRILYAHSQPLIVEDVVPPVEDINPLQKREYASDRLSLYREPMRTLPAADSSQPDEWARQSCDERMDDDRRRMPFNTKEPLRGPADLYNRFPSQQPHVDPSFDQGRARIPPMENRPFKHPGFAEGVQGRYPYPFLQTQGMPEPESQGRHFYRGQQPYLGPAPGPEADYSYDKFWSQGYLSRDQYSESALPQEMQPPDFDPVFNYLSSTKDYDQSSEKMLPAADFSSSQPRRLSLGHPYTCQTSPTPSSHADQRQFLQESNSDRKDPMVKKGLRNWRINSYLSAYDNSGDEGLPVEPPQAPDPFEEPRNTMQKTAPGVDLSFPKIPNVREFKVPVISRVSQIPNYAKTTAREQPKVSLDEPPAVAEETKTTPSESQTTNKEEKRTEEGEQNEPKTSVLLRSDSFRRKLNASGMNRCSRLRSSLIFSSLDQPAPQDSQTTPPEQKDGDTEDSDKTESEKIKLPFVSQVLGQRRTAAREPYEWTRYLKTSTETKPDKESTKGDDKNSSKQEDSKDVSEKREETESAKVPHVEQPNLSPSMPRSKLSEAELSKTNQPVQPPKPLVTLLPYADMNDPDVRLMFFKELAAKRKAEAATKAAKGKGKDPVKPETELKVNSGVKKEGPEPRESSEDRASKTEGEKSATADGQLASVSFESSENINQQDSQIENHSNTSQSSKEQNKVAEDLGTTKLDNSQSTDLLPASSELPLNKSAQEPMLSDPADDESSPSHPPTNPAPTNVSSLTQSTDKKETPSPDSTSKESKSVCANSDEGLSALASHTQNPELTHLVTSISPPAVTSTVDAFDPSMLRSSSENNLLDYGSQKSPVSLSSSTPSLSTTEENRLSEDSSSHPASGILASNDDKTEAHDSMSSSPKGLAEDSKSKDTSNQTPLDSSSKLPSSQTPSATDSVHMESGVSPEVFVSGAESSSSSLQSTTSVSGATTSTERSEKDISESEKANCKSEKDPSVAEKSMTESEIQVSEPEKDVSETEIGMPELDKRVSELEKVVFETAISETEKAISATSDPGKGTLESEKSVSESEKDLIETSKSENDISESEKNLSQGEKCVSEPEKSEGALSETENAISEKQESVKDIFDSEKSISEPEKHISESEIGTSESETAVFETEKAISETSDPERGTLESEKGVSESQKSISETSKSENDICELETRLSQVERRVSGSENIVSEPDKSERDVSESEIGVSETEKAISEKPESEKDISESEKTVSESEEGVTESEKSLSQVENIVSEREKSEGAVFESEIGVSETEKAISGKPESEKGISETAKTVSESEEGVTETEKEVSESEIFSVQKAVAEDSVVSESSHVKGDIIPSSPSPPEPCVPELKEPTITVPTPTDTPAEHLPSEASSTVITDSTLNASQSETTAAPQDAQIQATPPSDLNFTGAEAPIPAETGSRSSPLSESVEFVLPPEAKKAETNMSALHTLADTNSLSNQTPSESDKAPKTPSSTNEPTSEPPVPAENSKTKPEQLDTGGRNSDHTQGTKESSAKESVGSEKTNDQIQQSNFSESAEITSKQPKSSQSRYHSSTANVLSSSNLRDDTKLLLEQISANSQSRNEATKESPVTDDEKEDKADKNAKREKERGLDKLNKEQKSPQEREKLLERIQNMRKERKVYSRFEV
ncbi:protein FAM83H isoform X2 [Pundamilia nyererei]|uniref:Protein FAM83H isoform X2 n=1 Tax=Pundamilia nyererei TaxID=303518 RepID=A0A9Y6JHB7_9CICH|nr:PREDICTED: protein FAM83H-like isoform X2 [Pundamilia nyererei]